MLHDKKLSSLKDKHAPRKRGRPSGSTKVKVTVVNPEEPVVITDESVEQTQP